MSRWTGPAARKDDDGKDPPADRCPQQALQDGVAPSSQTDQQPADAHAQGKGVEDLAGLVVGEGVQQQTEGPDQGDEEGPGDAPAPGGSSCR